MKKIAMIITLLCSGISFAKGLATKQIITGQNKFDIRKPIGQFYNKYKDGLRLGIATGALDVNGRARYNDESQNAKSVSSNETAQSNFQLQIGYEDINLKTPGFSTFAIYQNMKIDDESIRNMRIAGNATYGITEQAYIFGGLNYAKYFGPGVVEKIYNAGIGYQAGVGLKIHKKAQLEIEYLTLLNEGRDSDVNYDISAKGIILKINTPILF